MFDEQIVSLCQYRMNKALQCLKTSQRDILGEDYASSANRSYYAIFHGIRAVMALDELDFKKHSAVIAKFRELYIKTGVFDLSFSRTIGEAFDLRADCDYEDFYLVTKQEVVDQLKNAEVFLDAVQKYLNEKISMQ
ncbi:MAG: HEPN domain-containing protein [Ruminococcaceae bacterium]|nr:HEPN domain-containing protein [Oscillospiraceae bacterium]